jgi:LDH2 family malate/lactate/ureidoglycolate dehydrogenase
MTGALVGARLSNRMDLGYVNEEHGGFLMVVNIEAFNSQKSFREEVSEFNKVIREQKPKKGKEVIAPGDNNQSRIKEAKKKGTVEVEKAVWDELVEISGD